MDISVEAATVALLAITCVNACILAPIQMYFTRIFWQYAKENISFFTKRHPSLVIFNCVIFNFYPLLIRPTIDYLRLNQHISHIHPLITFCINIPQLFAVLLALRLWLLYYDWNHSISTLSIKWKSKIADNESVPWTMRYKYLSDLRILAVIALIFCSFLTIVSVYVHSL